MLLDANSLPVIVGNHTTALHKGTYLGRVPNRMHNVPWLSGPLYPSLTRESLFQFSETTSYCAVCGL